jgi:DUF1680 family protein
VRGGSPIRQPGLTVVRYDDRQLDGSSGISVWPIYVIEVRLMSEKKKYSRRNFVTNSVSATFASCFLKPEELFAAPVKRDGNVPAGLSVPSSAENSWKQQGILDLAKSPYAKLRNVPVHAVTIESGFWTPRREVNVNTSIPSMQKLLEANGRMDNFRRLSGGSTAEQRGPVYSDSDVYKWLEAVGFVLQSGDDKNLRIAAEKIIQEISAAQQGDGYLNTYYVPPRAAYRMEPKVQKSGHELYCIGHLLQGAIAYYRATGQQQLLDVGLRFVNNFLLTSYGPEAGKKPLFSGHPEMELALVELYRITGDKRHLDLAGYLLVGDSRIAFKPEDYVYHFCGIPFTSRKKLEGHAVRAMYACCGAADYYLETGDAAHWNTLNVLWKDLVGAQMYVTGGVGARSDGEAFGDPYELPNATAYGESCAAIGNMMWNWRMLAATGEAKYTDVIERALYNGINSGMSLRGTLYCYRNPLAFDPSTGDKIRNDWYDTTCCPPNLERTFASLPGYFYSTSKDGIYAHLYHNSTLDWRLEDGIALKVRQQTDYPQSGSVSFTVSPAQPSEFTFYLRIPSWAEKFSVKVNGQPLGEAKAGEYFPVRRLWSAGDTIQLDLDMNPQVLEANSQVVENTGRTAVQRGPLVYCLEQLDQPAGTDLRRVALDLAGQSAAQFRAEFEKELLGGVEVLKHEGLLYDDVPERKGLYYRRGARRSKAQPVSLKFIPYYAWANRVPTPMQVWTPVAGT